MTNAISIFTQAVPSVLPSRPVKSDEVAALAFFVMIDTVPVQGVAAVPQPGKAEARSDRPEVSVPGEDQPLADESAPLVLGDVVPQIAVLGLPQPWGVTLTVQPEPVQPATGPDLRQLAAAPLELSDILLPTVQAENLAQDLAGPELAMGQGEQATTAMNIPPQQVPVLLGMGETGIVEFGPELIPVSLYPLAVAAPNPALPEVMPSSTQVVAAGGLVQALPDAQTVRLATDDTPAAVQDMPVRHADFLQTTGMGAETVDQPAYTAVSNRLVSPVLPVAMGMSPERPVAVEPSKLAIATPPDQPTLISGAGPWAPTAVVMRQTSDTALFGFQMRVQEMAMAPASAATQDQPITLATPSARPIVPFGPQPISTPDVPSATAADRFLKLPEWDAPLSPITGTIPFSDIPLQTVPTAPHHRSDTPLPTAPPVGLRDLPQAAAMALRADPAQPFSIQLDPIELGTVAFNMDTGPAGLVVTIIAERPETLELLRRHADQFLADLRQSGFQGASLQFGQSGTSGQDQRRPEHMPAPLANPLAATAPQFEKPARNPASHAGSGLDLRL